MKEEQRVFFIDVTCNEKSLCGGMKQVSVSPYFSDIPINFSILNPTHVTIRTTLVLFLMDRSELEVMLQRRVKFEIEALSVHSISFLSEKYIPSKIHSLH